MTEITRTAIARVGVDQPRANRPAALATTSSGKYSSRIGAPGIMKIPAKAMSRTDGDSTSKVVKTHGPNAQKNQARR